MHASSRRAKCCYSRRRPGCSVLRTNPALAGTAVGTAPCGPPAARSCSRVRHSRRRPESGGLMLVILIVNNRTHDQGESGRRQGATLPLPRQRGAWRDGDSLSTQRARGRDSPVAETSHPTSPYRHRPRPRGPGQLLRSPSRRSARRVRGPCFALGGAGDTEGRESLRAIGTAVGRQAEGVLRSEAPLTAARRPAEAERRHRSPAGAAPADQESLLASAEKLMLAAQGRVAR